MTQSRDEYLTQTAVTLITTIRNSRLYDAELWRRVIAIRNFGNLPQPTTSIVDRTDQLVTCTKTRFRCVVHQSEFIAR
jgi:hypothetical protein